MSSTLSASKHSCQDSPIVSVVNADPLMSSNDGTNYALGYNQSGGLREANNSTILSANDQAAICLPCNKELLKFIPMDKLITLAPENEEFSKAIQSEVSRRAPADGILREFKQALEQADPADYPKIERYYAHELAKYNYVGLKEKVLKMCLKVRLDKAISECEERIKEVNTNLIKIGADPVPLPSDLPAGCHEVVAEADYPEGEPEDEFIPDDGDYDAITEGPITEASGCEATDEAGYHAPITEANDPPADFHDEVPLIEEGPHVPLTEASVHDTTTEEPLIEASVHDTTAEEPLIEASYYDVKCLDDGYHDDDYFNEQDPSLIKRYLLDGNTNNDPSSLDIDFDSYRFGKRSIYMVHSSTGTWDAINAFIEKDFHDNKDNGPGREDIKTVDDMIDFLDLKERGSLYCCYITEKKKELIETEDSLKETIASLLAKASKDASKKKSKKRKHSK